MFFDRENSRSPKIQLIQTFAKRLGLLNLDISIRVIRWRRRNLVNSNERIYANHVPLELRKGKEKYPFLEIFGKTCGSVIKPSEAG